MFTRIFSTHLSYLQDFPLISNDVTSHSRNAIFLIFRKIYFLIFWNTSFTINFTILQNTYPYWQECYVEKRVIFFLYFSCMWSYFEIKYIWCKITFFLQLLRLELIKKISKTIINIPRHIFVVHILLDILVEKYIGMTQ